MQKGVQEFANMRIKNPQDRVSQKEKLSSDASILAVLMKHQPLVKRDLIRKALVTDSTFSRVEPLLIREKLIKITDGKYYLFNYNGDEKIEEVIKQYKSENKSSFSIEYLANQVGRLPEDIRPIAYKLACKYGIFVTP